MMGQTVMKKDKKARHNSPVFNYVSKGVYSAQVFGYQVLFERPLHNLWEARVSEGPEAGKLLAAASTRTKAMIEAFNNVLRAEQKRLDWVLADEPLRTYGARGNYKTDIETDSEQQARRDYVEGDLLEEYNEPKRHLSLVNTESLEKRITQNDETDDDGDETTEPMSGKLSDFLTAEQKLRIRKFYKIRKNRLQGGFNVVRFNSKGIVEGFDGPFDTAGEAYEEVLRLEGVEIPPAE